MRGVIVGRKNKYAAVLMDDGSVRKILLDGEIGTELEIPDHKEFISSKVKRQLQIAACAAIVIGAGGCGYFYSFAQPVSYVTMDVNPSLEYSLNRANQVLSVEALNSDGEVIVEELNKLGLVKCSISEEISATNTVLQDKNYLDADGENYVLVDVVSDSDSRRDSLMEEIESLLTADDTIVADIESSSLETKQSADELGMSTGRYEKYAAAQAEDPGVTAESFKEIPVENLINKPDNLPSENADTPDGTDDSGDKQPPQKDGNSDTNDGQMQEDGGNSEAGQPPENDGNKGGDITEMPSAPPESTDSDVPEAPGGNADDQMRPPEENGSSAQPPDANAAPPDKPDAESETNGQRNGEVQENNFL